MALNTIVVGGVDRELGWVAYRNLRRETGEGIRESIWLRSALETAASAFSPDSEVTTDRRRSAALRLRQAIFAGELDLYALLSPGPPIRLFDNALFEEALCPKDEVLTFSQILRRRERRFDLSWQDLKKLSRDPLCLNKAAFRKWLDKEARKKTRAQKNDSGTIRSRPGRPSQQRDQTILAIEKLHARGVVRPPRSDTELHRLLKNVDPSLKVSIDTVRRANRQFAAKKSRVGIG